MRVFSALILSSPLWTEGISLGLRSGVNITPQLAGDGPQQASASRFTIGPLIEVHLWRDPALGGDLLLRRSQLGFSSVGSRRGQVWQWEAPITLIYRIRTPARPFVRAGVSFNRVFDISGVTECGRGPFGEQFYCLEGELAELRHRGVRDYTSTRDSPLR